MGQGRAMAFTIVRVNHVHADPSDGSEMSDRYRAALDIVTFLDQHGLNAVQLDEHHVSSTGWSPTPMMTAGMILSRTERVLCMIGALLLPLHDPLRVAEDLAVLDLVGKGRLVVTMGLGYRPLEYAAMGKEWERRGAILDENLDVLLRAWTGEPFEHRGEIVQVLPKPYTQPHPNIMIGGSAKASARRAVRLGLPFSMGGNKQDVKAYYEQLCADAGIPPVVICPEEAPQTVIVDDPDRAWAEHGRHFLLEAQTYHGWQQPHQKSVVHSHADTVEELRSEGIYQFLTPDEAVAQAREKGSMALHPLCGGMPLDVAWRCAELAAESVLAGP